MAVVDGVEPVQRSTPGLRRGVRVEAGAGVAAFGTTALLNVLASQGRLTPDELSVSINTLRDEYCVDFPLDPMWLMATARRDEWQPGPALLTVARPTTWVDLSQGFQTWREIANKAGDANPANVAAWVHAAASGIISTVGRSRIHELVPGILVAAAGAAQTDPAGFAACVEAANAACRTEQTPSPTEPALQIMFDHLTSQLGPATAATALAKLGARLSGDDRHALRHILFDV